MKTKTERINLSLDVISICDIIDRYEELEEIEVKNKYRLNKKLKREKYKYSEVISELSGCSKNTNWRGLLLPSVLIRKSHFAYYPQELKHSFLKIKINGATYFYRICKNYENTTNH